jgi:hypothetical protein
MEEFHRQVCSQQPLFSYLAPIPLQDVAAACIFLATKTEECGRKLVDVARIYQTKVLNLSEPKQIPEDSQVRSRSARLRVTVTHFSICCRKLMNEVQQSCKRKKSC